jgi:hypothetical protein
VKRLFRIGLLMAIVITSFSSAALFVRSASASPDPAAWPSRKNKNPNKHKKEMKKRKKMTLKGPRGKRKEKHT